MNTRLWIVREAGKKSHVAVMTDEQALDRLERGFDLVPVEGVKELTMQLEAEATRRAFEACMTAE